MEPNENGPRLLRVSDVARILYGTATVAMKARVTRLVDRGDLRALRLGPRGDRWVPREAVDELLASATSRPQGASTVYVLSSES
jgi:hypothetical protein